jgi:hypothetical protein
MANKSVRVESSSVGIAALGTTLLRTAGLQTYALQLAFWIQAAKRMRSSRMAGSSKRWGMLAKAMDSFTNVRRQHGLVITLGWALSLPRARG